MPTPLALDPAAANEIQSEQMVGAGRVDADVATLLFFIRTTSLTVNCKAELGPISPRKVDSGIAGIVLWAELGRWWEAPGEK